MSAKKRTTTTAAKAPAANANPFRETIVIAEGPNVNGLSSQAVAAQEYVTEDGHTPPSPQLED